MRCFLAVPVLEPALGEAGRWLGRLRASVADVRWARAETLHMTVHFFGQTSDDEVQRALRAVQPTLRSTVPFDVDLHRLASFPPRGPPRVLWLGATSRGDALTALALQCRAALHDAGITVETRPFRAHCTLGRPRPPWPASARTAWEAAATESGGSGFGFRADRLILYESVSAPGGSLYLERAVLRFGDAG